jgi:hypothetical protein
MTHGTGKHQMAPITTAAIMIKELTATSETTSWTRSVIYPS